VRHYPLATPCSVVVAVHGLQQPLIGCASLAVFAPHAPQNTWRNSAPVGRFSLGVGKKKEKNQKKENLMLAKASRFFFLEY